MCASLPSAHGAICNSLAFAFYPHSHGVAPDAAASKDAHGAVTNNAYEEGAIVVNANAEA